MKLKTLVIGGSGLFLMVFSLLLFVAILFSDEQDGGFSNIHYGGVDVSAEVLAHKPMVEKVAKEYGIEEYVNILLAIIQVESGGTAEDVMQSSESLGLPPNSLSYVQLVTQYLVTTEFDDDTVQAIMDEALKFEGWKYVYGGASPTTSFDCSGLTQWTYGKAGINLPRTAQQQYDVTRHIPLLEAKAGDLVFFHSTYNAGSYITHIGIYLGDNRMFHAGDPIGYADLTSSYWQQHLVGAGRIKQ